MNAVPSRDPLREVVTWLARYAGFPQQRLKADAEALVCVAALAASDDPAAGPRFGGQRSNPAQASAMRTHGLRRSQVHFKCDNSAKV